MAARVLEIGEELSGFRIAVETALAEMREGTQSPVIRDLQRDLHLARTQAQALEYRLVQSENAQAQAVTSTRIETELEMRIEIQNHAQRNDTALAQAVARAREQMEREMRIEIRNLGIPAHQFYAARHIRESVTQMHTEFVPAPWPFVLPGQPPRMFHDRPDECFICSEPFSEERRCFRFHPQSLAASPHVACMECIQNHWCLTARFPPGGGSAAAPCPFCRATRTLVPPPPRSTLAIIPMADEVMGIDLDFTSDEEDLEAELAQLGRAAQGANELGEDPEMDSPDPGEVIIDEDEAFALALQAQMAGENPIEID
jgi:hypothetical protein